MTCGLHTRHPECKLGEVFLTNASAKQFHDIGWHSKRPGNIAYFAGETTPIPNAESFPVFVQISELQQAGIISKTEAEAFTQKHQPK